MHLLIALFVGLVLLYLAYQVLLFLLPWLILGFLATLAWRHREHIAVWWRQV